MSDIHVSGYCECPFSAAIEFAELSLREQADVSVSPGDGLSEKVTLASRPIDDWSDSARRHDALLLAWTPRHRTLFPQFRGVLLVRPQDCGVRLELHGTYTPPFGFPGAVFDALVGERVARRTMERLLEQLTNDVERRWRAEKASVESPKHTVLTARD